MFRLFAAGIIAMMARGAAMPGPSQFYVVSVSFSDYGPSFYYRILDVKQDGPDSVVRYVRIAPVGIFCPKLAVQAVEARMRDTSPAQLAGKSNPCAVRPEALQTSLKPNRRLEAVFEAISFGVVAQCGASSVALALAMDQKIDLKGLANLHPVDGSVVGPDRRDHGSRIWEEGYISRSPG